ncbi:VOC family protein [Psychromicrobium xiongbiense]|uniref:VOC family protein n=1 Tax=Psychromicrobium xiongbiense TaxID=3051184 RepID=UPI0025546802|nr:VOC family protein [Psychromicrobium sp. YIM S02556]
MTQRIVANIWCNRTAEEAGAFYAGIFPRASSRVTARYPTEGLLDFQREFAGEPLTVEVDLDGYRISLINAGSEFRPNPAISFLLNADPLRFGGDEAAARDWIHQTWTLLAEGGTALMALGEYPQSPLYGWVEDRYGVSWQLMLTAPTGVPAPAIIPVLVFGGPVQNSAREAIDLYTGLIPDSALGRIVEYPAVGGPAVDDLETDGTGAAGSVMFADFFLAGQAFAAMDSRVAQDFTFTPGLSLQIDCGSQDEIDHLWEALSTVPEAEQCGWLVDPFGVSWQVVPANMDELMERPDAFQHMMAMKKLVIADF